MATKKEHKRQTNPFTKSRVGRTPMHVHNLAAKQFDGKPSTMFERDKALNQAVIGDIAPEFNPEAPLTEKEASGAEAIFGELMQDAQAATGVNPLEEAERRIRNSPKWKQVIKAPARFQKLRKLVEEQARGDTNE